MSLPEAVQVMTGQHVWAKIVDCRPWPAYVIKKRRPTSKHKDQHPVHFYGPIEEFSWVRSDSLIPITADNLVEFGKDCAEDEEFFAAMHQAYNAYAEVCSRTGTISRATSCFDKTARRSALCQTFFRDCVSHIRRNTQPGQNAVGALDAKCAELLQSIFDDAIPPPACLQRNSGADGNADEASSTTILRRTTVVTTKQEKVSSSESRHEANDVHSTKSGAKFATETACRRTNPMSSSAGSPDTNDVDSSKQPDDTSDSSSEKEPSGSKPSRASRRSCVVSPVKASTSTSSPTDATAPAVLSRQRHTIGRDVKPFGTHTTGKTPPPAQNKPTRKRANSMTSASSKRKTSRVGGEFQATVLPCADVATSTTKEGYKGRRGSQSTKLGTGNGSSSKAIAIERQYTPLQQVYSTTEPQLVWDPTHCTGHASEDTPPVTEAAFQAYLDFSCAKGILGAGNPQRSTSRGQERAHHVYHKATVKSAVPSKHGDTRSVMMRALLELTDRRTRRRDHNHHKDESGQTYYYHYEGESVWTPEEIELFKEGLRGHGKNFAYIQSTTLKTKTLPELVEFYYCFKTHDDYKPIRSILKQREMEELKRIEAEGFLTCDNCASTRTVEWHVGDNGQDWCDSCHAYFTKRTVCTTTRPPVTNTGKPTKAQRASTGRDVVGEYKCTQCDRVFPLPNSLYGHMRVHAPPKPTLQTN